MRDYAQDLNPLMVFFVSREEVSEILASGVEGGFCEGGGGSASGHVVFHRSAIVVVSQWTINAF